MKKLLFILALALISTSVMAEWAQVGKNDEMGIDNYIDFTTIRKTGDIVKMWSLNDSKAAIDVSIGQNITGVMSIKSQDEYDCKEERSRNLAFIMFTGNMGRGKPIPNNLDISQWSPISPGSTSEAMWKIACDKQ